MALSIRTPSRVPCTDECLPTMLNTQRAGLCAFSWVYLACEYPRVSIVGSKVQELCCSLIGMKRSPVPGDDMRSNPTCPCSYAFHILFHDASMARYLRTGPDGTTNNQRGQS